jgi:hypothetical protein
MRQPNTDPEDVWFSDRLLLLPGGTPANGSVSVAFSQETVVDEMILPLGFHSGGGGFVHPGAILGSPARRNRIWEYCPEMRLALQGLDAAEYVKGECNGNWRRKRGLSDRALSEEEEEEMLLERMVPWGLPVGA